MPDHVPCETCSVRACLCIRMYKCVRAVADPGFSPGGGANSQKYCYFSIFFAKNSMKMKNFGTPTSLVPPWICQSCVCQNSTPRQGEGGSSNNSCWNPPKGGRTPRDFFENISLDFIFMQFSGRNGQILSWYPSLISKAVRLALPMEWKWSYERHYERQIRSQYCE